VILYRWYAGIFLKHFPEVGITNVVLFGKTFEVDFLVHILPDVEASILYDLFHPLAGEIFLFIQGDHIAEKLHHHPGSNLLKTRLFFQDIFKYLVVGIYEFLAVAYIYYSFPRSEPGLQEYLVGNISPESNIMLHPAGFLLRPVPVPVLRLGDQQGARLDLIAASVILIDTVPFSNIVDLVLMKDPAMFPGKISVRYLKKSCINKNNIIN